MKKLLTLFILLVTLFAVAGCQYESDTIVIGEGDWDSNRFYNQVVKFILEEGYDETVEITQVSTSILVQSLVDGTIDVNVETWSDNMPTYNDDIANGHYEELGVNFDDNYQGLYIPAYVQEANPGLVSVQDLADYKHLFPDPEVTGWDSSTDKAVVYGGPSGWSATQFLVKKFENAELYPDLVEHFDFRPLEATATLNTTIASAFADSEPWVGYNWEPTAIMGQYDMVLLEDDLPYDVNTGSGNFPTNDVTVVAIDGFRDAHPEATTFLSLLSTSSAVVNDVLAYKDANDMDIEDVAIWWLENNEAMWSLWVTEDAQAKINDALDAL